MPITSRMYMTISDVEGKFTLPNDYVSSRKEEEGGKRKNSKRRKD